MINVQAQTERGQTPMALSMNSLFRIIHFSFIGFQAIF